MILIVKENSDDSYCKRQPVMILIVKDNSDDPYRKRQQ